MKSINYLIFLSLGLSLWFLACDKGSSPPEKSAQPTNVTQPDTGPQANNGSQRYQSCHLVTDMSECSTAVDMQGVSLGCAVHNVDSTKCVEIALVNQSLSGCGAFNGANIGDCAVAHTETDENGNQLKCKASIWYADTCVPDGMENAVKTCTDIDFTRTGITPKDFCKDTTLGMTNDGKLDSLNCAENTHVDKCLEASLKDVVKSCNDLSNPFDAGADCLAARKFVRNLDGSLDITNAEPANCAVNVSKPALCVDSQFASHKTECREFDAASCVPEAKLLDADGSTEIDGHCGVNEYTKTCGAEGDVNARPASCAQVADMDKCEGLKLPSDQNVQALCRKNPRNPLKCQNAPELQVCEYDAEAAGDMNTFLIDTCKDLAEGACIGYCSWKKASFFSLKKSCNPADLAATEGMLAEECRKPGNKSIWQKSDNTLVPGRDNCKFKITINSQTAPAFCRSVQ